MEEVEASVNPKTMEKEPAFCEECKNCPSKYKCPGCSLRSCSLPCVKAHKQRTGCTGKRNVTKFVPIKEFDDNLLLSDYNMLEEVKRIAESANRARNQLCGYPSNFRLPFALKNLRSAAASRGTKLWFQPNGMSKREKNQTRYNQREKCISWTIEWRFHSTDVVLTDHGVTEERSLRSVIEKHLTPCPWNHKLKHFSEKQLENLKFFIRTYPKGPKSPFRQLDVNAPIRKQLANITIAEYPLIHVFLPSHQIDFEVVQPDRGVNRRPELKDSTDIDNESQKGVTFMEEEIEEANNTDTQVYDLAKHNENLDSSVNSKIASFGNTGVDGTTTDPNALAEEMVDWGEMKFDFDQDLFDVYSDIMAEINDDYFLPLGSGFAEEPGKQVEENQQKFLLEDLEEGEIAD